MISYFKCNNYEPYSAGYADGTANASRKTFDVLKEHCRNSHLCIGYEDDDFRSCFLLEDPEPINRDKSLCCYNKCPLLCEVK